MAATHHLHASDPRAAAEAHPLLRPFPLSVLALGATLVIFAVLMTRFDGGGAELRSDAAAPLVASAATLPAAPPQAAAAR